MMMMTKVIMMPAAARNTDCGNNGTQSSTAGSYSTETLSVNHGILILISLPLLKVLIQKEMTADTSHVSMTVIWIQVTDNNGYFPA